jgi:peptide/nickel transport system permease protein
MVTYLIHRVIQALFVVIIVSLLVFFSLRLMPGDPILMYLSSNEMTESTPEEIAAIRHEFGLDQPIFVQYVRWLGKVLTGDLGMSIIQRSSVSAEIARRLPITLYLGFFSFIFMLLIGVPFGVISAIRRGKWVDTVATLLANFGITVPIFWLGILLIYFIGLKLKWLPIFGYTSPFKDLGMNLQQIIMPVLCLSIFGTAAIARQSRSSMLEVIHQEYIRTAWSKGLREGVIIRRHALKNGLIPVITLLGLVVRNLIGGSVIVETLFNIPGVGRFAVTGLLTQDYAVVEGVILVISLVITSINLLIDISYGWIDPRIRLK